MTLLIDFLQVIAMFVLLILVSFGIMYGIWLTLKFVFICIQLAVKMLGMRFPMQVLQQMIKSIIKNGLPLFLAMITTSFSTSVKNMVLTSIIIMSMFGVAGLFAAGAVMSKIVVKIKRNRNKIKKVMDY